MNRISVFVPGHISGFFRVYEESNDPLKIGSRNCGPCIDRGVVTSVEVEDSTATQLEIFFGDEKVSADTSEFVASSILERVDMEKHVRIFHDIQAPIGSGYGMSGAGALGVAMALSKSLNLSLDRDELLSVAHKAEVTCRSGLGDVGPQREGGLVISVEPGGPPYGMWKNMDLDQDWEVICGTMGSLSTSRFLESSEFKKKATELGEIAIRDLMEEQTLEKFMKVSKKFAIGLGIYGEEFLDVLEIISSNCPCGASAVLLGKGIFAPVRSSQTEQIEELFLDYFDSERVFKASIDLKGARFL